MVFALLPPPKGLGQSADEPKPHLPLEVRRRKFGRRFEVYVNKQRLITVVSFLK